ncbi:MAG: UDP-N-acetylglucosamine 1-carboxyvinyltransferase [Candidatus Pacebacteria bacterium]|jgi:UDP-N-acetylglucosamine 1-carboxyvinyltransferase|nr:UDP-N-acetylglucosamine 1-carboxyvinyltransferase [bacterium]MDP6527427.1 UDP-N-acetylglucosamine 1-carboxyvinyltransferase [Candidatus Paceibacterota bacterium]MDP6659666.1 UDP-N-acetylglucosamine 1-carboxyvinyltransferase [Candidatus Paceibacterota bacterium]|tara:strand:+ start:6582 stop:7862 length:1281 start_codon:yes stop_codon:yes gene_type:complete
MKTDSFEVVGLGGERKLSGEIKVNKAKNAVLKAMASTTLFSGEAVINEVPELEDVGRMAELLEGVGVKVSNDSKKWSFDGSGVKNPALNHEIAKRFRGSIVLTGPLLGRLGEVSFAHPGGCVIGARPIDLFLKGFEKMGATVTEGENEFKVKTSGGRLKGAEIFFPIQSHTATETLMMAAMLAEGKTILKNAALEPEVVDLAEFLNRCGADIVGAGTPTIEIEGGELLSSHGYEHTPMPDRIEAGSFVILGAMSGTELKVSECNPSHLESTLSYLKDAGVDFETGEDFVSVRGAKNLNAISIKTHEYPGFPTDLQAPMAVLQTQAKGESTVFETIFEGRLNYTADLVKMGADITLWNAHQAGIKGPTLLKGHVLEGPDLRAGLAYIWAAIVAKGVSVVNNVYHIDRGYERIEDRLRNIGVSIKRVN